MAGFRGALDSDGQPVREMYSGTGIISSALGKLGAKFKSWGREAQGLPPAEPIIDLSAQTNALRAWDTRMREGTPAPVVAPPAVRSTPNVVLTTPAQKLAAPASVTTPKRVPTIGARNSALSGKPSTPQAAAPVVPRAVMTEQVPGLDGTWLTQDNSGGYAEIAGDPSTRLYAAKADPALAPAAAAVIPERDTTYDPGTQGAWAREQTARNMLTATGGARGLTALAAFNTAEAAPGIAATTANATLNKQLLENHGKLAEAHAKGYYDINGKWVEAGSREKVATITGEANKAASDITGRWGAKRELISNEGKLNVVKAEAPTKLAVAKEGSANKGDVTPALEFTTMAESLKERRKALAGVIVTKKNAAQHAKDLAALDEDETLLYGKKRTPKDLMLKAH